MVPARPPSFLRVHLEFGHASVGVCTGAKIEGIKVEPNEGGVTLMRGGKQWLTLPAGYIGYDNVFFYVLLLYSSPGRPFGGR